MAGGQKASHRQARPHAGEAPGGSCTRRAGSQALGKRSFPFDGLLSLYTSWLTCLWEESSADTWRSITDAGHTSYFAR